MLIVMDKDNKNTIQTVQVYSVTVMTHVFVLEAGVSNQGTLEPTTPVQLITNTVLSFGMSPSACLSVFFHLHHWEIGIARPIQPTHTPIKQCTTGRGLLSLNVLLAMLIIVTVFSSH